MIARRWNQLNLLTRCATLARSSLLLSALVGAGAIQAGVLYVPNNSFESPLVPPVSPYAGPDLGSWQKTPQPVWYDPAQNENTPWDFLMGTFYNAPFPETFIENADGSQASFLFALPEAGIFQDYTSVSGTNTVPAHDFNATYSPGKAYSLTVGVIGGSGGMKSGVTLQLRLYYRDDASNKVTVAATTVTNSPALFPTNTHFVDFEARVPSVKSTDPWAGKNIGIEISSTVGFELAGGYWDVDNVRLVEQIYVPNASFELPVVPPVSPYALPILDSWQKTPQPFWYDPAQNENTPWDYLMGTFYNVPFPEQFIVNADGSQASFLFALPDAGIFQDYDSLSGTNTVPSHEFDADFTPGKTYTLTVGVIGGSGGMKPGATLQLGLYYRDASNNILTIATTTATNSSLAFPTNTLLVDYQVDLPAVKATDAWAGKNIGIQILSTAAFDLAGGYWDVDNVRLMENVAPAFNNVLMTNGAVGFTLLSEPGERFEIQASSSLTMDSTNWTSVRSVTNVSGAGVFTEPVSEPGQRFYRAQKL